MTKYAFYMWIVSIGFSFAADRPNIVLIMADDIGVENLSCYGSTVFKTPNIDKIAETGIRFNHAHTQPICTPSRVQLMSGIYNNRNYVEFGLLDPEIKTFGNYLKESGYKTCIAGKWQLEGGFKAPVKFGFDKYCLWQLTRRPSRYPNPGLEIDGVEKNYTDGEFGPDVCVDYIEKFITENSEKPFFVYYPMIAPHYPFVPTPDHADWDPEMWRDAKGEPRDNKFLTQTYWEAMVHYTDKMVGRILDHLSKEGLLKNTLIIWTADNGTYTKLTVPFKGEQYKGGKGSTKDAGTHVGFVASWPEKFAGRQVKDDLVDLSDILPTVVELAGEQVPRNVDGVSLVPLFKGEQRQKDYIYCWYSRSGARKNASQHIRNQRYKLYSTGELYDIKADRLEKRDLSKYKNHEVFKTDYDSMKKSLDEYLDATKLADPIQNEKRAEVGRSKKAAKSKAKVKNKDE